MVISYSRVGEWASASICFLCFVLSVLRAYQVIWVQQKPAFSPNVKIIQSIIPIALLTRGLVMTLNLLEGEDPSVPIYNQSKPYQLILGDLPGYLYFGVYSILCLAFVERYQIWNLGTIASRIILVGILAFVLTAFLAFGLFSILKPPTFQKTGHEIEVIFSVSIHSLLGFVFVAMGVSSIIFLANTAAHKIRQKSQHHSVAILANIAGLVFWTKGAFIALRFFYEGSRTWRVLCHWIYVLFFEVSLGVAISVALSWSLPSTVGAIPPEAKPLVPPSAHTTKSTTPGTIISFSPSDFED